jgi:hypothetical protein
MGKAYRALFGTSAESLAGRKEWYATHDPDYQYSVPLPGVDPEGFVEAGINETSGETNTVPVDPIYRWYNIWSKEIGTEWLVDATNFRLRELVLAYNMPGKRFGTLAEVQISLVRNLFFFIMHERWIRNQDIHSNTRWFEHCSIPTLRSQVQYQNRVLRKRRCIHRINKYHERRTKLPGNVNRNADGRVQ